jgi:hypothetical protein
MQVELLWIVTPRSDVVGYQRFGGPCCLHLHLEELDLKALIISDSKHGRIVGKVRSIFM